MKIQETKFGEHNYTVQAMIIWVFSSIQYIR